MIPVFGSTPPGLPGSSLPKALVLSFEAAHGRLVNDAESEMRSQGARTAWA